jgi:hypothetical protein
VFKWGLRTGLLGHWLKIDTMALSLGILIWYSIDEFNE